MERIGGGKGGDGSDLKHLLRNSDVAHLLVYRIRYAIFYVLSHSWCVPNLLLPSSMGCSAYKLNW